MTPEQRLLAAIFGDGSLSVSDYYNTARAAERAGGTHIVRNGARLRAIKIEAGEAFYLQAVGGWCRLGARDVDDWQVVGTVEEVDAMVSAAYR